MQSCSWPDQPIELMDLPTKEQDRTVQECALSPLDTFHEKETSSAKVMSKENGIGNMAQGIKSEASKAECCSKNRNESLCTFEYLRMLHVRK